MSGSETRSPKDAPAPSPWVPRPVVTIIACLFTGAMVWNVVLKGEAMVTVALASAVPFIIGVPVGRALLTGGSRDT